MWLSIAEWTCGVFAVVLGVVGLFWDRPGWRGRPALRCRKCWFDLTATPGVGKASKDEPVVCPECGRRHVSIGGMRRTRRRKQLILGALACWLVARGLIVLPAVRDRGWVAALPGWALVATVPFYSEQETSSDKFLPNMMFARSSPGYTAHTGLDTKLFDEILVRLRRQGKGPSIGWASRRLVFLLGRLEDADTLTNTLTMKGIAYRTLVSTWITEKRALGFERAWARDQVVVRVTPDTPVYGETTVYGHLDFRCLSGEPGTVLLPFGGRLQLRQNVSILYGGGFQDGPLFQAPDVYRERNRFDQAVSLDASDNPIWDHDGLMPLTTLLGSPAGSPTMTVTETIRWSGDDWRPWNDPDQTRCRVEVELPPGSQEPPPPTTTDPDLAQLLQHRIEPVLVMDYDRRQSLFLPTLRLKRVNWGSGPRLEHDVIIGGRVTIGVRPKDKRFGNPGAIVETKRDQFWMMEKDAGFEASGHWGRDIRFGVIPDDTAVRLRASGQVVRGPNEGEQLVVRISNYYANGQMKPNDLQGLHGDMVFAGDLEIPLNRWTPDELRRFIVSGYVPDHAMGQE